MLSELIRIQTECDGEVFDWNRPTAIHCKPLHHKFVWEGGKFGNISFLLRNPSLSSFSSKIWKKRFWTIHWVAVLYNVDHFIDYTIIIWKHSNINHPLIAIRWMRSHQKLQSIEISTKNSSISKANRKFFSRWMEKWIKCLMASHFWEPKASWKHRMKVNRKRVATKASPVKKDNDFHL